MPTYGYRGTDCPHEFEVYQPFTEDALTECVECGKPVRRVIHPTGIVFKGSGWYITDSRKSGDTSGGSSTATKSEKPGSGADASTSTSPDTTKSSEPAAAGSKKD